MKNTRKVNVNVSVRKAEMMRRRRMFFKSLLVLGLSITAIVALWNKTHKTYICDINFVNDCIAVWEVLIYSLPESQGHIACNNLDVIRIALMLLEVSYELINGSMILALGSIYHFAPSQIYHYCNVIMAFSTGFINAYT